MAGCRAWPAGGSIRIRGSERLIGSIGMALPYKTLQPDSEIDFSASQAGGRYTQDRWTSYILNGRGSETHEPLFFIHGFRYLDIQCSDPAICIEQVRGVPCMNHSVIPIALGIKSQQNHHGTVVSLN